MNPTLAKRITKTFAQMLVDIKTPKEAETLLEDFFNKSELETYTKRLAVAYWLKKGRTHENIKNNLKVSSVTITSVEKLLNTPGFKIALKKLEAEEWATLWAERIKKVIK